MPDPSNKPPKGSRAKLATWIAGGGTTAAWCRQHGVSPRTAYRWCRDPKFQDRVEAHRQRAADRAIGLLARHAAFAVEGLVRLAKSAEAEPVRLSAQRGILAELREMSDFASLSRRFGEIERRLDNAVNRDQAPTG